MKKIFKNGKASVIDKCKYSVFYIFYSQTFTDILILKRKTKIISVYLRKKVWKFKIFWLNYNIKNLFYKYLI